MNDKYKQLPLLKSRTPENPIPAWNKALRQARRKQCFLFLEKNCNAILVGIALRLQQFPIKLKKRVAKNAGFTLLATRCINIHPLMILFEEKRLRSSKVNRFAVYFC